ncbi:MAG TPA: hypothetical protein VMU26_06605 [Candidatus Polarisedimenticolia bacterium]|nr:hypothetical protein [Candidatus Polarisedimenticolia bacterium]
MKKSALLYAVLVIAPLGLVSCNSGAYGGANININKPPSGLNERVLASQSASSPSAAPGLIIVNGFNDTVGRGAISAGSSPTLMETSPERAILLAFDSATNKVEVVSTTKETLTGSIQLPGPTTSIAVPQSDVGFAAVPTAPLIGSPPGAVVQMNLASGGVTATISVPNAQTVISNSSATQLLVFSNDSDAVTIVSPLLVSTGSPVTVSVPGFDRPVYGFYSGSSAYILNCGAECGGTQASVQILNLATTPPTAGALVPVDGATIGFLSGSTLYVAGNSPANSLCTGETTAAKTCGRLDTVDLGSMTVTNSAVITDGYHDRIDMGLNSQLFIGAHTCTNVGNVNNVTGEVRGCLSIYNVNNKTVVIPPDNGDVTGLQSFTTRYVEYVAEGGNLRVYDTITDVLLDTDFISTGTITITGVITDVKAVDFF